MCLSGLTRQNSSADISVLMVRLSSPGRLVLAVFINAVQSQSSKPSQLKNSAKTASRAAAAKYYINKHNGLNQLVYLTDSLTVPVVTAFCCVHIVVMLHG